MQKQNDYNQEDIKFLTRKMLPSMDNDAIAQKVIEQIQLQGIMPDVDLDALAIKVASQLNMNDVIAGAIDTDAIVSQILNGGQLPTNTQVDNKIKSSLSNLCAFQFSMIGCKVLSYAMTGDLEPDGIANYIDSPTNVLDKTVGEEGGNFILSNFGSGKSVYLSLDMTTCSWWKSGVYKKFWPIEVGFAWRKHYHIMDCRLTNGFTLIGYPTSGINRPLEVIIHNISGRDLTNVPIKLNMRAFVNYWD